jgi:hypothetical protein
MRVFQDRPPTKIKIVLAVAGDVFETVAGKSKKRQQMM